MTAFRKSFNLLSCMAATSRIPDVFCISCMAATLMHAGGAITVVQYGELFRKLSIQLSRSG